MASRRAFLASLGAIPVAFSGASAHYAPKKYGRLTVYGHRAHLNTTGENLCVYLDGVYVEKCCLADDIEGFVEVFCRDEEQHKRLDAKGAIDVSHGDDGGVCRLRATGTVVIKPGAVQ